MTRDDFSSTTLIAIQVPYMITIMKMRIVIPNASMSWPTIAAVSPIGSVRAGSGQVTANWAGANTPAWSSPATPRRSRRSATAIALAPCHASVAARPLVSFVYSVNASSPAGDRSIDEQRRIAAVHDLLSPRGDVVQLVHDVIGLRLRIRARRSSGR